MRFLTCLSRVSSRWVVVLFVALAWSGAMLGLAGFLAASQAGARRGVAQRLSQRTAGGAEFASLYVRDILAREQRQASIWLTTPKSTAKRLARASSSVGFSAAVLLDQDGRVLQASPAKPDLVGKVITGEYPHLAAAVAGSAGVSNVVRSAARGVPVVAFAVPFETIAGRRVFSGAFDVSRTPLGAYMSHLIVTPGRRVYLVDATGSVIANSGPSLAAASTLSHLDSRLAGLARTRLAGSYASARGNQYFVRQNVSGTPWQIVVAVPEAQLYVSLDGSSKWLAWLAVASLALAGLIIILIGLRLLRSRARLRLVNDELGVANRQLDRLARIDVLTGLRNRRDVEETLIAALSSARRHQSDLAVLLIDIDHFKAVNDTFGHKAGDRVLVTAAETIQATLRTEDSVGRWGGEEFLAVLPDADAAAALLVAERLCAQIAKPGSGDTDPRVAVTATIGAAVWVSGGMDDLISRADAALYAGKTAGRNNVQIAPAASETELVRA